MSDSGRSVPGEREPGTGDGPTDGKPGRMDPMDVLREAEVEMGESDLDAVGIGDVIALFRDADIREFEELVCRGDGAVVRVTVEQRVDGQQLSTLDAVDRWTHVADGDGHHEYVVAFTAPELPDGLADEFDDLVGNCDPELHERGATMSLVGTQETISNAVELAREAGVRPSLRKLGGYRGRDGPLDALTDRQREVLRTAYEQGHYEVPSGASTADVAAELGLDPSTVAEHLQRAERNLLSQHFE